MPEFNYFWIVSLGIYPPLTSNWPHLRCDVGLEDLWWTKIRAVLSGRLTVSGFDLAWFSSLSSKRLCVFGLNGAI